MNSLLIIISLILCAFIIFVVPGLIEPAIVAQTYPALTSFDFGRAVLLCAALAAIPGLIAYRQPVNGTFLLRLFGLALLLRIIVGLAIFVYNGQEFFGGDALTYDYYGWAQLKGWGGDQYLQSRVVEYVGVGLAAGWGMIYMIAGIYAFVGHNPLAVQLVNSVLGAATAILIFLCAQHLFNNLRVSRFAALAVAFYPSLVLWSSQGLKDGPIVFLLALSILATLRLGTKISVKYLVILVCSLFCLLSLRFYIFYMLFVAIGSAFLIGMRALSARNFVQQFAIIVILGLGLTYLGVTRYAAIQMERFGSLQQIQLSRLNASTTAKSGFAQDVDVSTTQGALSTIPVGMLYLLFAPFPWQLASLRQSITLPEMIIWWACFPLLVLGLWFSIKYRLRQISPVLIFTVMLSLAYSIFQGNVGTAYRQRAQLLVFYFIFVAVGYVLMLEKREEKKRQELAEQQALAARQAASAARRA